MPALGQVLIYTLQDTYLCIVHGVWTQEETEYQWIQLEVEDPKPVIKGERVDNYDRNAYTRAVERTLLKGFVTHRLGHGQTGGRKMWLQGLAVGLLHAAGCPQLGSSQASLLRDGDTCLFFIFSFLPG